MQFYKYQGTGNDFVMADDREGQFPYRTTKEVELLCNRRFGIGADGLILVQAKNGKPYMQYFNSDGGESSMCGNGGRCFVKFLYDLGLAKDEVEFDAIDGPHIGKIINQDDGQLIELKMAVVNHVITKQDGVFELNTGSPHYVSFLAEPINDLNIVENARAVRYNNEYASQGINVNFVNLLGLKQLAIRTYERGVEDETLSCGTGATAAALSAAIYNGLPSGKHELKVKVQGGDLLLRFVYHKEMASFSDIWLVGPAQQVFKGELPQL